MYLQSYPVSNHGISEEIIAATLESTKAYFSLPLETKMEARILLSRSFMISLWQVYQLDNTTTPNFHGYNAVLSGNNDPAGAGDMHEGFKFGSEALDDTPGALDVCHMNDGTMAGANVWPDVPGFRNSVLHYYHAAVGLGKNLFPLFARALDLAPDFFDDKTRNSVALMRVLHYPPQKGPVDERVIGIGAHTE
jgi:isopenicillin N synthase-like dioxygenase